MFFNIFVLVSCSGTPDPVGPEMEAQPGKREKRTGYQQVNYNRIERTHAVLPLPETGIISDSNYVKIVEALSQRVDRLPGYWERARYYPMRNYRMERARTFFLQPMMMLMVDSNYFKMGDALPQKVMAPYLLTP